jgi:hypothetical protein
MITAAATPKDMEQQENENVHPAQPKKADHEKLVAAHRAMYSTVKSATRVVSMPNQRPPGREWNAGTVSRMVMRAEKTIRTVMRTCTSTAAGDELGRSRRL